jgi:tetratricopeptide (TPR) repeat protein
MTHRQLRQIALVAMSLCCSATYAQERYVQDIQISRTGNTAEIVVEFSCQMRLIEETGNTTGVIAEVRVSPFESCRQLGLGTGIASEAYRPVGGQLAGLSEVEYESLGLGDNFVFFRFDRAVAYRVEQRADLREIVLTVDLNQNVPTPSVAVRPPPTPAAPRTPAAAPASGARPPVTVRERLPFAAADYVINLLSVQEPVSRSVVDSVQVPADRKIYISQTTLNGQTWNRLRLGFFESEAQAQDALAPLREFFPRAWIGRAEPEEVRDASNADFEAGGLVTERPMASVIQTMAATPRAAGAQTLSDEQIANLMDAARNAVLDEEFDDAASLYTQLLGEPGPHQQEAREYLGVAREKLGQIDQAAAEYRAYLSEYPNDASIPRVQQRLEGMLTAAAAPRVALRRAQTAGEPAWDFVTGVSQYYRRDVDNLDGQDTDFFELSALQSDVDFSARRSGGRYDMLGRISASHFYDLIGEDNNGPGDQGRVSYAYFDMVDTQQDWSLRVGRQSLHTLGVLGRFDGAHFSYGWRPDQRLHFMAGYPVDSTRDKIETDRKFYGVAADFEQLFLNADVSVFLNQQQIEGLEARQAIGTELHYAGEKGNITGIVDYDLGYGELNSILGLGAWRLNSGATVSGLIDIRNSPILTTRNALIGQPAATIEDLLLVWTEDEIRQLAADRTAQARTVTVGISQPLGERFNLNADLSTTEIDATVASGGVDAIPGTGPQTYLTTTVVGTGVFGDGDVNMLSLRYGTGDDFTSTYVTWDGRYAIGQRLRLNPRIRYASRDGNIDGTTRETVSLAVRLLYNTREHFRFEFEIGIDDATRTAPIGTSDTNGYYVNLGYRASY